MGQRSALVGEAMTDGAGRGLGLFEVAALGLTGFGASQRRDEGVGGSEDGFRGDLNLLGDFGFEGFEVKLGRLVAGGERGENAISGGGMFGGGAASGAFNVFRFGAVGDVERLRTFGAIAIDGNGFEAEAPGFEIGFRDVVEGAVVRQIDGFGDSPERNG